jgi:murein DD-endopeptidase MepM/ murein hydrolase activator NlpD
MAAGTVVFAGTVAGTRWLVVEHADGIRASYGRLASMSLSRGDLVRAGQRLGSSTHELYVGLRDGDRPVDPTPLLGSWRRRVRLVPIDGAVPRPAGAARLRCPNARSAG